MRKRVQVAALFVAVAVLVVSLVGMVSYGWRRPSEPMYQGVRLSELARTYASGYFVRGLAPPPEKHAIQQIGTNAMPTLLRMVNARDSVLTRVLMRWANKQSIIRVHFTPAAEYRLRAVAAFGVLGPAAKAAVPALVKALHDDDFEVRFVAADSLRQIAPEAAAKAGVK